MLFAAKKCVDLAVVRKSGYEVIGLLSFVTNGQRQGEIGWALGVEHRGCGYEAEAVRGLLSSAFGFTAITACSRGWSSQTSVRGS